MPTCRTFLLLGLLSSFLFGCTAKSTTSEELIKYLDKSLENSKLLVNKSTETMLVDLEEKAKDPATSFRGKIWLAKAGMIREYSNEMYRQIEDLKKKLMSRSINNNIPLNSVTNIDQEIKKVKDKLKTYNNNLLAIDPGLNSAFSNYVSFAGNDSSGFIVYPINLFSTNITVSEAIHLLNQFENNIKNTENRMVQFSNNKVSSTIMFIDTYSAIIAINSMRSEPGAKLEVIAGMGVFSKKSNPEVYINGKLFPISEDGAVHYKFSASQNTGKYNIPVRIIYTDEIGKRETIEKNVEYSVVK
jgi:hypothetical protein